MTKTISLALVDDHPGLLQGMVALFSDDPRYSIVGTAASADGAIALALAQHPDVMTLDLSMPGDVFGAMRRIAAEAPSVRMLVFTAFAEVDLALEALDAGVRAFVLKGGPYDDLFNAIETVMRGELFVSPGFSPKLTAGLRNRG